MADKWYTDSGSFWRARSIFNRDGRLDVLPDRGGFVEGERTPERLAFVKGIIESKPFKEWLKSQTAASSDIFEKSEGVLRFRATNNASYGYTYLWAWEQG